ncbi:MAG: hypothetical protein EOP94_00275 [Zymomonas sp.]|nr:MAG: hypothetical protein EOP94_00275 [Zymomonas sp.]
MVKDSSTAIVLDLLDGRHHARARPPSSKWQPQHARRHAAPNSRAGRVRVDDVTRLRRPARE